MAGDEGSEALDDPDRQPDVDFVVGAPGTDPAPAATPASDPADEPPRPGRLPPWLRQRGTLAGAAVVLIVLTLASRAFAGRHSPAPAPSSRPSVSLPTTPPVPGLLSSAPRENALVPGACRYPSRPMTVHTLPGDVTAAITAALPGVDVLTTSTQLGVARAPGPCVVQREIIASDRDVVVQILIRPASTDDRTDAGAAAGSTTENTYADFVGGGHTVHISASESHTAHGGSARTMRALSRLAADPRLVQA